MVDLLKHNLPKNATVCSLGFLKPGRNSMLLVPLVFVSGGALGVYTYLGHCQFPFYFVTGRFCTQEQQEQKYAQVRAFEG